MAMLVKAALPERQQAISGTTAWTAAVTVIVSATIDAPTVFSIAEIE
jgi:hypothetical protein